MHRVPGCSVDLQSRPSQQLFQDLPLPEGAPPAAAGSVAGSAGQGPGGPGAGSAPGSRALSRNPSIAASASGRPSGAMAVEPQVGNAGQPVCAGVDFLHLRLVS